MPARGKKPFKVTSNMLEMVYELVHDGANYRHIADCLRIHIATFYRHYDEFSDTIKRAQADARRNAFQRIQKTLIESAEGWEEITEDYDIKIRNDENTGEVVTKEVLQHKRKIRRVPNATILMFLAVNLSENDEYKSINNKIIERIHDNRTGEDILREMDATQNASYSIGPDIRSDKIQSMSGGAEKRKNGASKEIRSNKSKD